MTKRMKVPGHTGWVVKCRRGGVGVKARHRLLPWRTFAIDGVDVPTGVEITRRRLTAQRWARRQHAAQGRGQA